MMVMMQVEEVVKELLPVTLRIIVILKIENTDLLVQQEKPHGFSRIIMFRHSCQPLLSVLLVTTGLLSTGMTTLATLHFCDCLFVCLFSA